MATYSESGSSGNNSSRGGTGLLGAGSGQKDYDYLFKLLIIGDSGVGKSSLLVRFSDNTFTENYVTTIGVDFKIRTVTIDDIKIKLQIWDTAGQERFRTITSTYYRGTHGVIVVFDLTNGETFSNIRRWLQEIENNCDAVPKVLVGNKCEDIAHRAVTEEDARNLANAIKIQYFETSAKDNINVQQMFDCVTKMVLDSKLKASGGPNRSEGIKLTKKRSNGAKKKCCM